MLGAELDLFEGALTCLREENAPLFNYLHARLLSMLGEPALIRRRTDCFTMTVGEAALVKGVHVSAIRQAIYRGELTSAKVGWRRFLNPDEVARYEPRASRAGERRQAPCYCHETSVRNCPRHQNWEEKR